jgi:hypothetical protein
VVSAGESGPAPSKREAGAARLAKQEQECFNDFIETGVLHDNVGLRDTLEPDPGNTGVGSFRSQAFFFLDSQRESSCFMDFKNKGNSCSVLLPPLHPASYLSSSRAESCGRFVTKRECAARRGR